MYPSAAFLAHRDKLRELSDSIVRDLSKGRFQCRRSAEWSALPVEHRMGFMLIAGIDGDLSALAMKRWPEFTPAEHEALQIAIRSMHRSIEKTFAIRGRA